MTASQIVAQLKKLGSQTIKSVLMKHGAKEPFYGVKIEDLKKIQKKIKVNHELALELYDTGISDAMYLAGLIVDDMKMTKKDLQKWLDGAYWQMLSEYVVAWVAAGGRHGWAMGLKWIDSKKEKVSATGWSTLSGVVAVTPDEKLDMEELRKLLERVAATIHDQPDRTRYTMNAFVIAVGSYVAPLEEAAVKTARKIGKVEVDMGDTSCKVPAAEQYIAKVRDRGLIGRKRKTVKC